MRHRPNARPLPILAVLLLLSGCTADTDDLPAREKPSPPPAAAAADDPVEPAPGPSITDVADCMEGVWLADPDALREMTEASAGLMGMDGGTVEVVVTGSIVTTIGDGTLTTEYIDSTVEMTVLSDGQEIRSVSRTGGVFQQSFTLEGDMLHATQTDMSGATMEVATYINGEELPGFSEDFEQGWESGTEAVSTQPAVQRVACAGDHMEMVPVVEGMEIAIGTTVFRRR